MNEDFHPPGVTFMREVSVARWVEESLEQKFAHVGALIPRGFPAYARLFHPARATQGGTVRWSEVAAWSGRSVHPLMAFEGISAPGSGYGEGLPPWNEDPTHGTLDREDAVALAEFLESFTEMSERCFFAVWAGYGQFTPGAMAILTSSGRSGTFTPPEEVQTAERLSGVQRDYFLYTGSLSAITSFFIDFWTDSPNIWWPEDRQWCVATDIDLDSTYVGGTEHCIDALLRNPRFEALRTTLEAPTHMTADTINLQ